MRTIIFIALFALGLVWSIAERVKFETKEKSTRSEDYCSLYRSHNDMLILIFAAVLADKIMELL